MSTASRAAGAAAAKAAGAAATKSAIATAARTSGAGKAAAKASLRADQRVSAEVGGSLPDQLHGVPDSLRTWWNGVDPKDLETATFRTGRNEVLTRIGQRVRSSTRAAGRIVDLGCGCGLLAKETGRRDIVGVDIAPAMIKAAQEVMDLVLPESFLEYYPSERFDIAVLCNVLEPYPEEIRALVFRHTFEFLNPGGQAIVVIHVRTSSGSRPATADCSGDLVFPTITGPPVRPDEIEEGLLYAGFNIAQCELVETKTLNHSSVMPGEEPKPERRISAIITGRKPLEPGPVQDRIDGASAVTA